MNREDNPRGLNPSDRKEWHSLCERLFDLYDSMPQITDRKIISGTYEENEGSVMLFFKGDKNDVLKIKKLLDNV